MRRLVFDFTSLLSLLLCLTVVGLWLRSYRSLDEFSRVRVETVPKFPSDAIKAKFLQRVRERLS